MSAVVGELVWKVTGDTSGIDKSLKQTDQKAQGLAGNFKSAMGIMAGAVVGAGIAKKIFDIGKASLKAAANMETQTVAFTTMLGSADKAQSLIRQISEFAASTPFQLPEVVDASKKLIAFGESSETVVGTIRRLGDVASGLSIPLGELTEIYGKARVQGTLYAEDLNQLAGRGIPIFTELAKVMNVNSSQVKKLGSEGKITFDYLEKVFVNLTKEGGQFGGLMKAQSATLNGQWSNFNDGLERSAVLLGNRMLPTAKNTLGVMNRLIGALNTYLEASGERAANEEKFTSFLESNLKLWDGSVEKLQEIVNLNNAQSDEARLYLGYLSGEVKLSERQVQQLEKRLQLTRTLAEIQNTAGKAELESWLQRGLVIEKVAAKVDPKPDKDAIKKWNSERIAMEQGLVDFINQNTKTETQLLQMELEERKDALLKYSRDREQTAKWIADIEKIYADKIAASEEKSFQERLNRINTWVSSYGSALTGLLGAVQALNEAQGAQAVASLDARMQAELEAAGLAEDSAVQAARVELEEAEATGNQQVIIEKKKALEKAKIEEKYAKQKAKLEYETALQSWELQRAMAFVQMIQAPLNAYVSALATPVIGPFIAPGLAALAAITAGIQFAAVQASKPQAPQFEQGGIVPGSSYTGDNVLARVNSGEMVLNQQQQAQLFNQANGGGGGYKQVPPMSADSLWKLIFEASQSGDLFIAERAVTSR